MHLFLTGLFYFFFIFSPIYFLTHLTLNLFNISNLLLLMASSLAITGYFLKNHLLNIQPQTSTLSRFLLSSTVFLLVIINFAVGSDASSDTYFYHLNIALPIHLQHNLLEPLFFNLDSYSKGYPKYAEFLQSMGISLTQNFFGYGLITIFVIPASYMITYGISKLAGFEDKTADLIALTYSLNPINIAQATTGYIDSIQSLYLLSSILFLLQIKNILGLTLFLLNIVALLNIKFTGITLSSLLITFAFFWHFHLIKTHFFKYVALGFVILLLGSTHYLNNVITFQTPVFPFIDFDMAKHIANLYVPAQNKLEKLLTLFFFPSSNVVYDTILGAFSVLWYPMPFFMVIALLTAFYQKHTSFLTIALLLCTCLLLDPVLSIGRYVVYFQWVGFASFAYVLARPIGNKLGLMPLSYFALTLFIIFNPYHSLVSMRLAHNQQYQLLFNVAKNQRLRGLPFYYKVNSDCTGYYWYLTYYGADVQLTTEEPSDSDNYIYLARDTETNICHIDLHYTMQPTFSVTQEQSHLYFSPKMDNPFILKQCKTCIAHHGCMYIPFHIYGTTFDLSRIIPNAERVKKINMQCEAIDGQTFYVEQTLNAE